MSRTFFYSDETKKFVITENDCVDIVIKDSENSVPSTICLPQRIFLQTMRKKYVEFQASEFFHLHFSWKAAQSILR